MVYIEGTVTYPSTFLLFFLINSQFLTGHVFIQNEDHASQILCSLVWYVTMVERVCGTSAKCLERKRACPSHLSFLLPPT